MPRLLMLGCCCLLLTLLTGAGPQSAPRTCFIEHERDVAKPEPGPHDGGGTTVGYKFFAAVPDLKLNFKKRVLHPGSAIGWHTQNNDRAYFVVSGNGSMEMPAETLAVRLGDAILTRAGGWHALRCTGNDDLVIMIAYQ